MYELHLVFTFVLFLGVATAYGLSRRASMFHPVTYYLFFHGLVFAVRPLFQHFLDLTSIYDLYRFYPSDETKHLTLFSANISLITFVFVALLVGRKTFTFTPSRPPSRARGTYDRSLLITTGLLLPLVAYSSWVAVSGKVGAERGVFEMAFDPTTNIRIHTDSTGYLVDANMMFGPLTLLVAWQFRFRLLSLIPFLCFVFYRMYLGGGRWVFLMACASLVLILLYENKRKWPSLKLLLPALGVFYVFNVLGRNRQYLQNLALGITDTSKAYEPPRHFFDHMDFANLEYLQYVIEMVPSRTDTYDYFLRNLQVFTEPIPRILWPGKPIGPPIQLYNLNDYGFPIGITWAVPGEGWQALGIVGVVIWSVFAGAVWGSLYRWFLNSERSPFQVATYMLLLPISANWFRDGILLSLIKFPLFMLLPIMVWWLISRVVPR